ncbi:predicted protein [Nematostella vectensis]|uniref:G-protein coupled receptors family 1 profile domain-containing protein n=1 Tax=Nematostella vectensis TaxID=45351 RepID=A7RX53_NEMVE|nr:predicted protein [Nematostella vectensis]|eukprot:XP_001635966.1 predicted protein [Nematostella vectensis]
MPFPTNVSSNSSVNCQTSEDLVTNIATIVINALSAPFAIVFNVLVTAAIWKNPSLHTPPYVLLANLAIADLLTGLLTQPVVIAFLANGIHFKGYSTNLGSLTNTCRYLASTPTFLTLVTISLERCLDLYANSKYSIIATTKRLIGLCMGIWVCAIALACIHEALSVDHARQRVVGHVFLAMTGLTSLCTGVLQLAIVVTVRRHRRQIQAQMTNPLQTSTDSSSRHVVHSAKLTISLAIVIAIYVLCYLPKFVVALYGLQFEACQLRGVDLIVDALLCARAGLDPVFICLVCTDIENAVKRVLGIDHH